MAIRYLKHTRFFSKFFQMIVEKMTSYRVLAICMVFANIFLLKAFPRFSKFFEKNSIFLLFIDNLICFCSVTFKNSRYNPFRAVNITIINLKGDYLHFERHSRRTLIGQIEIVTCHIKVLGEISGQLLVLRSCPIKVLLL